MSLAVITINNASPALEHKSSEAARIARGLQLAAQVIQSSGGTVASGNILDDGGSVIGTFTVTNQASLP